MGHVDPDTIRTALASVGTKSRQDKQQFSNAERWRDRMSDEGIEAAREFFALTGSDNDQLRQLLGDLSTAPNQAIEQRLRRQIFRLIHDILAAQPQDV